MWGFSQIRPGAPQTAKELPGPKKERKKENRVVAERKRRPKEKKDTGENLKKEIKTKNQINGSSEEGTTPYTRRKLAKTGVEPLAIKGGVTDPKNGENIRRKPKKRGLDYVEGTRKPQEKGSPKRKPRIRGNSVRKGDKGGVLET